MGSPEIFCRWAAIVTIAGALERKVWTVTSIGELYPNLYVLLVGPAGVGKTVALGEASYPLFTQLKDHYVGSTNVSHASLIDNLFSSDRRIVRPQGIFSFYAMTLMSNELGVLLPSYDNDFMSKLTDFYDGRLFEERKRKLGDTIRMERTCLNLIAGTTPSYLQNLLPEGAWDQGFLSRTIMVYSGDRKIVDLWKLGGRNSALHDDLIHDLKIIGDTLGEVYVEPEVRKAFMTWLHAGCPPTPDHPLLLTYSTRRPAHLLKLCMIASLQRSSDLKITLEDYQRAMNWLIEAEASQPDIFKSMNQGGAKRIMEETWHFARTIYMKENQRPIAEQRLVMFIAERAPSHGVDKILEVMVKAGILSVTIEKIGKCYVPRPLKPAA